MDYTNHLKRAISVYGDVEQPNKDWTPEEHCVILLRTNRLNYGQIQSWLGNPSKKWIRSVLLKWNPELIDLDCNHHKLVAQPTKSIEKRLVNLLNEIKVWTNIETDEDVFTFEMVDNKLQMHGDTCGDSFFLDWDETTQNQIFNQILNGYKNQ